MPPSPDPLAGPPTGTFLGPAARFAISTLVVFAVLSARNVETLAAPALLNEDGRDLFGAYYNAAPWAGLARYYAGYLSLATNAAATLIAPLPVQSQPEIYVVVALAANSACMSCFALPIFRTVIRSDGVRLISCLLTSLSPLSLGVIDTEVGYLQWPISIVLFQLTAADALGRGSVRRRAACLGVMSLFAASIPSSVVLIPLLGIDVLEMRRRGRGGWPHLALMAVLALYAWRGRDAGVAEIHPSFAIDGGRALVEHVVGDGVFGGVLRQKIQAISPLLLYGAALALAAAASRTASRASGGRLGRYALRVAYISVVTLCISAAVRGLPVDRIWPRRFSYAQSVIVMQLLLSCLAMLVGEARGARRAALVVPACAFLALTNALSARSYGGAPADADAVRDLTAAVARAEAAGQVRGFHLERGAWSIDLRSRPGARSDPP